MSWPVESTEEEEMDGPDHGDVTGLELPLQLARSSRLERLCIVIVDVDVCQLLLAVQLLRVRHGWDVQRKGRGISVRERLSCGPLYSAGSGGAG